MGVGLHDGSTGLEVASVAGFGELGLGTVIGAAVDKEETEDEGQGEEEEFHWHTHAEPEGKQMVEGRGPVGTMIWEPPEGR